VPPICLHDRKFIETLVRQDDVWLHLYELGDLEEPFWSHTTWYGLQQKGPGPVLLLYSGLSQPTLLGLTRRYPDLLRDLLRAAIPLLPCRFYAHLSPGLSGEFGDPYTIKSKGRFYKMGLRDRSRLNEFETGEVIALGTDRAAELERLYDLSYDDHAFEPSMLETGFFYGIRRDGRLVCAAGVHVHSPAQQVAALGGVATHPDYRNRGLARTACARLCLDLLKTVDHIGLNVNADNAAAVACYRGLGFEQEAVYQEQTIKRTC
jgi:ribosomal protein S18 acetylase RimI-like enzyme